MLKNFLCADSLTTGLLVCDGLIILAAIALMVWYFVRNKNKTTVKKTKEEKLSKLDDDTYVMDDAVVEETPVYDQDNEVVHFVNQMTDINEDVNNELNSNAVVVTHEVEVPVKKIVAKEEISNFVEIGGEKKIRTEEEIATSVNRGTNAFKNATDFVSVIKAEQSYENLSAKKVSKKK